MKLKILAVVVALVGVCSLTIAPNEAYGVTCPPGSLNYDETGGTPVSSYAECNIPIEGPNEPGLMDRVVDIINVIAGVVGVVAIAVIVLGGILFVTSTGDAAKVQRAKNTVLYGVIGLVISLLAFAIVNFVLNSIFGPKP